MAFSIPEDKIQEIRDRSDVVDIISDYVSLKKRGRNYLGLCPFHQEKTPSFMVNAQRQFFHCFGCQFRFRLTFASSARIDGSATPG